MELHRSTIVVSTLEKVFLPVMGVPSTEFHQRHVYYY